MTALYEAERRRDGKNFFCPNGHSMTYGDSETKKLQRALDNQKQQNARLEEEAAEARRETERLEKRVRNGVCPCCTRSFTDLKRHMETKHPNVVPIGGAGSSGKKANA